MTKDTLVVIGTSGTLTQKIAARAQTDLGFAIRFEPLDGVELQRRVVLEPESFDIVDHWSTTAELAWFAGVLQPVDCTRLPAWSDVIGPDSFGFLELISDGYGAPLGKTLFVQQDGTLGPERTDQVVMVPTVHNCDSYAWTDHVGPLLEKGEQESWGWLLDPRFRGKVALSGHASISGLEAALAAQALGLMTFKDIGNFSVSEIDDLTEILIDLKQRGHFRGFWYAPHDAIKMLKNRDGCVQSVWAHEVHQNPGLAHYATPKEGYRAWVDGLFLSAALPRARTDMAYAYLNWWLSGWPGAELVRNGTFSTNPAAIHAHLGEGDWLKSFGQDGERYKARFGNVAVWNAFMDEHTYLTRKWAEFLSAGAK